MWSPNKVGLLTVHKESIAAAKRQSATQIKSGLEGRVLPSEVSIPGCSPQKEPTDAGKTAKVT